MVHIDFAAERQSGLTQTSIYSLSTDWWTNYVRNLVKAFKFWICQPWLKLLPTGWE